MALILLAREGGFIWVTLIRWMIAMWPTIKGLGHNRPMLLFSSVFIFLAQICPFLACKLQIYCKTFTILLLFFPSFSRNNVCKIICIYCMSATESYSKKLIPKFTQISRFYVDFSLQIAKFGPMPLNPTQEKRREKNNPKVHSLKIASFYRQ